MLIITCRCLSRLMAIQPIAGADSDGECQDPQEIRFLLNGKVCRALGCRSGRDASGLSPARPLTAGHQGRMCRGRLRRLHRPGRAPANGGLVYEGVNACIRFVGSWRLPCRHGRSVWRNGRNGLHPVQQAMVDTHAFAMRFLHARLRHVALRVVDAESETEYPGNREGSAGQSLPLHWLCRNHPGRRKRYRHWRSERDPLVTERARVTEQLLTLKDGKRVVLGEGRQQLVLPGECR